MTMIIELPPEPAVVYKLPSADAYGNSGLEVARGIEHMKRHWEERAEWILANSSRDDTFEYSSVPLEVTRHVKVKYKMIGEIQPMPFEWDD